MKALCLVKWKKRIENKKDYKDIQTSGKNEYSRYSGFPHSSKTNISKFQIDQDQEPLCGCATSKSLFTSYLFINETTIS